MSNFLSIDFGLKRVGIASADSRDKIAFTLEPIVYSRYDQLLEKLAELIRNNEVSKIIVGVPLGYEDKETQMSLKIKQFVEDLRNIIEEQIDIILWNEVLTSKMAGKNLKKFRIEKSIDSESARIILQEFLDHNQNIL